MIMVKLSKNYDSYNSYEDSYKGCFGKLGSDLQLVLHMAEDENGSNINEEEQEEEEDEEEEEEEEEAGSKSSKDVDRDVSMTNKDGGGGGDEEDITHDQGWLQLGVGSSGRTQFDDQPVEPEAKRRDRLIELDLLPSSLLQQQQHEVRPLTHHFVATTTTTTTPTSTSNIISSGFIFQNPSSSSYRPSPSLLDFPLHQEITSGYSRPYIWNNPIASSSSSSIPTTSMMPMEIGMGISYHPPPFQYHGMEITGPSLNSTTTIIIDPPPRLRANVWFMLKASPNQTKEPFLPQIPKSYLRIKDGRMTVRLLMKYLVNKLRLNSESEIAITCREQQLPPFYTLQYVRDNVWSSATLVTTLNQESSTASDHVMILHYSRSA